jgi:hypothetical protein
MDGRTFRYHDNHEFFRAPAKIGAGGQSPSQTQTVARKRPANGGQTPPPAAATPGEHRRHCTAGEVASELGYSVSYILAVRKAMYPDVATRPRRLDPVEVSEWIFAHPSFRMREVYECHPKEDPRQEQLGI